MKKQKHSDLLCNIALCIIPLLFPVTLILNAYFQFQLRRMTVNLPLYAFFVFVQFVFFAYFIWCFFVKQINYSLIAVAIGALVIVAGLLAQALQLQGPSTRAPLQLNLLFTIYFHSTFFTLYALLFIKKIVKPKVSQ